MHEGIIGPPEQVLRLHVYVLAERVVHEGEDPARLIAHHELSLSVDDGLVAQFARPERFLHLLPLGDIHECGDHGVRCGLERMDLERALDDAFMVVDLFRMPGLSRGGCFAIPPGHFRLLQLGKRLLDRLADEAAVVHAQDSVRCGIGAHEHEPPAVLQAVEVHPHRDGRDDAARLGFGLTKSIFRPFSLGNVPADREDPR